MYVYICIHACIYLCVYVCMQRRHQQPLSQTFYLCCIFIDVYILTRIRLYVNVCVYICIYPCMCIRKQPL